MIVTVKCNIARRMLPAPSLQPQQLGRSREPKDALLRALTLWTELALSFLAGALLGLLLFLVLGAVALGAFLLSSLSFQHP